MDRNTLTGILLIAAIMIGWMYFSQPSEAELKKQKQYQDSIALVAKEQEKKFNESIKKDSTGSIDLTHKLDTSTTHKDSVTLNDSIKKAALDLKYGGFVNSLSGTDSTLYIENELIKASISKKGGRITSLLLKQYKRFDSTALYLFDKDS